MKVLMIGTPTCMKCKNLAPRLKEYCQEHSVDYEYINLENAPSDIVQLLISKNVKSAPAFLIYKDPDIVVVSGDDIFLELNHINLEEK